jgi:hypothetical protein
MQMYLWTGPTPDYDGTADADVIIHEVTHGTSNRLHGNASGLSSNMSRGMGEGWSDFYAHVLLSEPTDPLNGVYSLGGYATYLVAAGFSGNYYYGIRRYPKAVMAFTGGANNKPHNAYTFSYINSDCNTRLNNTNFAYARGPIGVTTCDQVHNIGEIWSSALWEVRGKFVTRLGWAVGNRKVLQLVTDGMKLAPVGPTLLQERDAIIAAAQASAAVPEAAADVSDMWSGFALRGMGFNASVTTAGTGANNTVVVDSFDLPNAVVTNPITVSDASGDNDGYPEPNEAITLSVPVTNNTGATVNNVQVSIVGGGTVNYGSIANGQTVTNNIPYTVPADVTCGANHTVTINLTSSVGSNTPKTYTFRVGAPVGGPPTSFTNSTPIDMPSGQPATTAGPFAPYPSTIDVTGLTGSKIMKLRLNNFRHEFEDDLDMLLVGPGGQKFIFMSDVGGSTEQLTPITFSISDTGDTLLPDGAAIVDGQTYKPSNVGASDPFDAPAPTTPYENAAPGGSATFASVFGNNGANLNGTWSLYGDDDASSDPGRIEGGWTLTFESDDYACSVNTTVKSRADFDGDGKTDLSVFRPSEGNWYLNRSTAGFSAINWGLSTDTVAPGDFDGDGKADVAIFRPSNGTWYVLQSSNSAFNAITFGTSGDTPVQGDYDGDGKADAAVFRSSTNVWYILNSGGGTTISAFGASGDVPVRADYDGDAKTDIAIFRAGQWWINKSSGGTSVVGFGLAADKAVPADYDGDNKDDVAVYRNGVWYILRSSNAAVDIVSFGLASDIPVPGDYDGDGKDDQAIYRGGTWWMNRSTSGVAAQAFGLAADTPVPSKYIP